MSCLSLVVRHFQVLAFVALSASVSQAQDAFKTFKQLDSTAKMPKLNAFSPSLGANAANSPAKTVAFEAKLTSEGGPMQQGLSWRVFSPIPGPDGKLPLVATAEGGSADFS